MSMLKQRLTAAAVGACCFLSAGLASANCVVITDGQFDSLPQLDILSVEMFQPTPTTLGATFTLTAITPPIVDGIYAVHWTDASGAGYYLGVWALADAAGQGLLLSGEYGTYDAGAGSHSYVGNEGEVSVSFNGTNDQLTVIMQSSFVGSPSGTLSNMGAIAGNATLLLPVDSTSNDGEWAVGSTCSRSADELNLADNLESYDGEFYSASGALGWMLAVLMVLGLARRRG